MAVDIALIGAGSIGARHIQAIRATDRVRLTAIVDPAQNAANTAQELGVKYFAETEALFSDLTVSGAIIGTPTEHHNAPALTAMKHGAHVMIEKPISASNEEAAAIIAATKTYDRHALIAHHRRYYPTVDKARDLVQGGSIGKLVAVSGQWAVRKHDSYYEPDWRKKWQAGPVMTNFVHEIDYLRHICGPVAAIMATTSNAIQGFEKEDAAACLIRFESGALGSFVLSDQADSPWTWEQGTGENAAFPRSGQNAIRFMGTKGSLDFPNLQLWTSDGTPEWRTPMQSKPVDSELGDAFVRQIEHFADVIEGRASPKILAEDGALSLAATLAVLESAKTNTWVTL